MMHEVSHSLETGEIDDNMGPLPLSEVYSGSGADDTPESVEINGQTRRSAWSIMRRGYVPQVLVEHRETTYFSFSIEELLSVEEYDQEE